MCHFSLDHDEKQAGGDDIAGASSKHPRWSAQPKTHLGEPHDPVLPCDDTAAVPRARCPRVRDTERVRERESTRLDWRQHKENSSYRIPSWLFVCRHMQRAPTVPPTCQSPHSHYSNYSHYSQLLQSAHLMAMEKLQVCSLWAAHLMSWTAFVMVLVWALAYQVGYCIA